MQIFLKKTFSRTRQICINLLLEEAKFSFDALVKELSWHCDVRTWHSSTDQVKCVPAAKGQCAETPSICYSFLRTWLSGLSPVSLDTDTVNLTFTQTSNVVNAIYPSFFSYAPELRRHLNVYSRVNSVTLDRGSENNWLKACYCLKF